MTRTLSQKFRFFTFICIALLAYVHGYNLRDTYLTPFSTVDEPLTITAFIEYFLSNGILRFRIPLLFMISGYLYALYDHRPYKAQIKSRMRNLLLPYLLWSALGLLLTFVLQQIPYTANIVFMANLDQMGDNRPYAEIGWHGMVKRWLFAPISYQLWFLFTLFIFNLLYPAIRWMVVRVPYIWLPLTFLYFFLLIQLPFLDSRGLFFFSAGVWLQKKNYSLEKEPPWFSLGLCLILFIGLCTVKTFMAFELEPFDFRTATGPTATSIVLTIMHQASIIAGIFAMWFGADKVIQWFNRRRWFQHASSFSFFVFGLHVPLLPYLMTWATSHMYFLPVYRLFCYVTIPFIVLVFCIWVGALVRQYVPFLYRILTGGRGF